MKNKKITAIVESYYPIVFGIIFYVIGCIMLEHISIDLHTDTFDKILDSLINFTSIIIGFIGVLIGILFSIRNSVLVDKLFKHKSRKRLKKYFIESFISGVLLIIFSIIMYLRNGLVIDDFNVATVLFPIWIGLMAYMACSSYRIIYIMILIVFNQETAEPHTDNDAYKLSSEQKTELDEKYNRDLRPQTIIDAEDQTTNLE